MQNAKSARYQLRRALSEQLIAQRAGREVPPSSKLTPNQQQLLATDDRKDLDGQPAKIVDNAGAVAAVIPIVALTEREDGKFVLGAPTLGERYGLAPTEKFGDQPAVAQGTAFLIREDLIVTAAHVVGTPDSLERHVFVFGFRMNGDRPVRVFDPADVFTATLLATSSELAVLRLDHATTRKPLALRMDVPVAKGEPLYIIGHPVGLPAKVADNASVIDATDPGLFKADLDAMACNSGSPVFNADDHTVVGVLIHAALGLGTVDGQLTNIFASHADQLPVDVERITTLPPI